MLLTAESPESLKTKEDSNPLKYLLHTRTILLSAVVDAKLAEKAIEKILILEAEDPKGEITLVINSPGGEMGSGFAIFDTLAFVSCPITTIVAGLAASMGSVLSLSAEKKRRFALPFAKIMIHQPLIGGTMQGQATDLAIHSEEMLKERTRLAELYAEKTGKKAAVILKDMDRNKWFNSSQALEYGLIGKVITHRKDIT